MFIRVLSFIIIISLFLSFPSFAKKKEADIRSHQTLGAAFLLIGTSAVQAVEDILKGVKKVSKQAKYLTDDERDFLFAYANYKIGKYQDANKGFLKLQRKKIPIKDYLLFYQADIALNKNDYKDAYEFLVELLKDYPESVLANQARIMMGQVLAELGSYEQARTFLEYPVRTEYNLINLNVSEVFSAKLYLIKTYIKQNNQQEALIRLKSLALSVASHDQLVELSKLAKSLPNSSRNQFQDWVASPGVRCAIAESLLDNSQYNEVIEQVKPVAANYPVNSELGFKARRLTARSVYRVHKYQEAIDLTKELLSSGQNHGLRLALLRQLARSYERTDAYDKSIEIWKKIIHEYPNSRSAVLNARFSIAQLLVDDSRYVEAIQAWKKVLNLESSGRQRTRALWYLAWCYYQTKDYESAIKRFDYLLQHKSMSRRIEDRLLYWKARSYENMGDVAAARKIYNQVLAEYPLGYYAFLTQQRLGKNQVQGQMEKANWRPGKLSYKQLDLSDHLRRAIFFDRLKLYAEAAREIEAAIVDNNNSSKRFILWLASRNQAHYLAYRIVLKEFAPILRSFPQTSDFDLFVWHQSYPQAYQAIVQRFVGQNLDPDLVYSLMRAESTYQPEVVSAAGAIGLMQLMPTTAKRMSDELGETKFDVHDLYKPAKNIEYGITYLKKLYDLFPDNTAAVLASYNAGEEAVARWLNHGQYDDIEEFIEEIPYDQTNQYVKKVLRFYWLMKMLYNSNPNPNAVEND
ncbi:MAG: transglycosylase SLT domain-containing protein [Pseudomonadota bacterium]